MLSEVLILELFLCGLVALAGVFFKSLPLRVVSALGLIILSFQVYLDFSSLMALAMMWILAFFLILKGD